MPSNKTPQLKAELPGHMATPVVGLKDLGRMVADANKLPSGHYELVVEYKFGPGRLAEEGGPVGAMAITFGGLGLRPVEKESPMTIEVKGPSRRRKKTASAVPRKAAKKAAR